MTTPQTLYKAVDPARVKAWEDSLQPLYDTYLADVRALETEFGRKIVQNKRGDSYTIVGYEALDHRELPRPGFRRDAKAGYMLPDKRNAPGKALAARLNAIEYKMPARPGLPSMVLGDGRMGAFRIEELNGQYFAWLAFSLDPNRTDLNSGISEVDPTIWATAPLSEYHLAKEAQEARG